MRPLEGRVILVTRPARKADDLARRLADLGAEAIAAPTIEIDEATEGGLLDDAIAAAAAGRFDWVVFSSAAGVRAWAGRATALGAGVPAARVAVVGEATAEEVRTLGLEADLVPAEFTTEALGKAFPPGSGRVLLARADIATEALEDALRAKGWTVERVEAYRIRPVSALPDEARHALEEGRVDAATFTSPSTVDGFVRLAGTAAVPAVCIGPVTAAAAEAAGLRVLATAEPHTEEGLVGAVVRALA